MLTGRTQACALESSDALHFVPPPPESQHAFSGKIPASLSMGAFLQEADEHPAHLILNIIGIGDAGGSQGFGQPVERAQAAMRLDQQRRGLARGEITGQTKGTPAQFWPFGG